MGCSDFEVSIALLAGGDLEAEEQAAVEEHLAVCPHCRGAYAGYTADRSEMAALAEHPGVEFAASVVRTRVIGRLRAERLVRALAAAAVILVCIAAAALWAARRPVATLAVAPPAPGLPQLTAVPVAPRTLSRVPAVHQRMAVPTRQEPVLVKLETDDPNVVIYWIAD